MTSLIPAVRNGLLAEPEVSRLSALRRSTSLFSQEQVADSAYLIDEGLIKLTRSNGAGGRIILAICGPGQLIGEEVLAREPLYMTEAEVLTPASVLRIPRGSLLAVIRNSPELANAFITYLLDRKLGLAEKVELLCLHDVEYRILHYLAELSTLVAPQSDGEGHQIPITQLELADLIGATRETTSTTLNQLERRGLIKLSRRLLTVSSPTHLRNAAAARSHSVEVVNGVA